MTPTKLIVTKSRQFEKDFPHMDVSGVAIDNTAACILKGSRCILQELSAITLVVHKINPRERQVLYAIPLGRNYSCETCNPTT